MQLMSHVSIAYLVPCRISNVINRSDEFESHVACQLAQCCFSNLRKGSVDFQDQGPSSDHTSRRARKDFSINTLRSYFGQESTKTFPAFSSVYNQQTDFSALL